MLSVYDNLALIDKNMKKTFCKPDHEIKPLGRAPTFHELALAVEEIATDSRGRVHGKLLGYRFKDIDECHEEAVARERRRIYAPGCGTDMYVEGTNGGTMPCGARLKHLDGSIKTYFCGKCDHNK
jgi:hypothetical protein